MSEAIPSWARVGVKVVCVDADDAAGRFYNPSGNFEWFGDLVKGETYTIVGFDPHPDWNGICVQLAEIDVWHAFAVRRFRPLVSQADDISTHFAHLLDIRAPETAQ